MEKLKKILAFLKEYDFFWSIPIGFISFILYPVFGALIWGDGFSSYSPEFFHAAIYAGLVAVLFSSFTQMGIFFNFPKLYEFYLGEGFDKLEVWQKSIIFLLVYAFLYCSLLLIWSQLV